MGSADLYVSKAYSFTHQVENTVLISKKYLPSNEKVLIIDDFLANGAASRGAARLIENAGAKVSGIGILIEKSCAILTKAS